MRPFFALPLTLLGLGFFLNACHYPGLHASHGQRIHEVMGAQLAGSKAARPTAVRAEEIARIIHRHDERYEVPIQQSSQSASNASLGAGMMSH